MASAGVWLALTLVTLASAGPRDDAPCAPEFRIAKSWAIVASRMLVERGVPSEIRGPEDTLPMLTAAASALFEIIEGISRTTMFLEMFSGTGGITREVVSTRRLVGYSFDIVDFAYQNITSLTGMMYAMYVLSSIAVNGSAHFAPQCSTWLNMAMWHTQRRRDNVIGDDSRKDVRDGNHTALVVSSVIVRNMSVRFTATPCCGPSPIQQRSPPTREYWGDDQHRQYIQ